MLAWLIYIHWLKICCLIISTGYNSDSVLTWLRSRNVMAFSRSTTAMMTSDYWGRLRLIMFHRVMNYLFFISVWWNNNTIDCSQSPIFPWDRRDQRLCVKDRHLRWVSNLLRRRGTVSLTLAPSVHLKIKMAPFNGKTRYISTISQENRGMWTV